MKAVIRIRFEPSSSRRYDEALAVASKLPGFTPAFTKPPGSLTRQPERPFHEVALDAESFWEHRLAVNRLWTLIRKWHASRAEVARPVEDGAPFSALTGALDWIGDPEPVASRVAPSAPAQIPDEQLDGEKPPPRAVPDVRYSDVGGLDPLLATLREVVEWPLQHPEWFTRLGISPHRGALLHGPPGCGKTLVARAIAAECGAHFIPLKGPELISKYQGESEENLRAVFEEARQAQPAIIFFDEIDAIGQRRSSEETLRHEARFVNQLLTLMDGFEPAHGVFVLAATNRPELLDEALTRPGRFDRSLKIPLPDEPGRRAILGIHTRNMPLAGDVNLDQLAADSTDASGADLAFRCREAAYACMRECAEEGKDVAKATVHAHHFLEQLSFKRV